MQTEVEKIFGIGFGMINQENLSSFLIQNKMDVCTYICFVNTFVATRAHESAELMNILNKALFCVMDGTPLAWSARMKRLKVHSTVSGYWLMKSLLQSSVSHFFYGASPERLSQLKSKIVKEYPQAHIKGFLSPPMINERKFNWNSLKEEFSVIKEAEADIIWVGISSPKQDYLMYQLAPSLSHGTCLGVGAVFDYMIDVEKKSPEWIKKIGLRWLFRLVQNPKKHFKKYLIYNTKFIYLVVKDILRKPK